MLISRILWSKGKAIGFAFSAKSTDFENPHFLPKSKPICFAFSAKNQLSLRILIFCQAIGFAFSAKSADFENPHFSV